MVFRSTPQHYYRMEVKGLRGILDATKQKLATGILPSEVLVADKGEHWSGSYVKTHSTCRTAIVDGEICSWAPMPAR